MVEHLYRFRPHKRLLEKDELRNQEIYFAGPDQLNDPMEGFRDVFWQGDEIVWKNFFRHFVICLDNAFSQWMICAEAEPIEWKHIPVFNHGDINDGIPHKEVEQEILAALFAEPSIQRLITTLASYPFPIRRDELAAHLRAIHIFILNLIRDAYARAPGTAVPDFIFTSPFGSLGIEATTINPPNDGKSQLPDTAEEMKTYLENFIPMKLGRALRRKLGKTSPYWTIPEMDGLPFCLAIQDFHHTGTMRAITQAATDYVFGVRHSIEDGEMKIERIDHHVWGKSKERSGFFSLPGAENVSAVIVNPQGTLSKFTRMGHIAGFGDQRVKIIRRGLVRGEHNKDDPRPRYFVHDVSKPDYSESWVEGMVVLHNPNARIPLPPPLIDGASHEFLQEDGRLMSLFPEFHPYFSETIILAPDDTGKA
jgi:hypothetical protein